MPKSRGRKRPSARRTRPSARTTWQAAVLKSVVPLLNLGTTRHHAEVWASGALADASQGTWFGERLDARNSWVESMLSYADRRRTQQAAALVLALDAVCVTVPEGARAWAKERLSHLAWAASAPLRPIRITRGTDLWGDHRNWFLEYDDHVLVITTARARVLNVLALDVLPPGTAERWDAIAVPALAHPRDAVDVDEALAELASLSDLQRRLTSWRDPAHRALAALLEARLELVGVAPPSTRIDDDARCELLSSFAHDLGLIGDDALAELVQPIFDFADKYLGADPLLWSPELVETLLLDWLPYESPFPDVLPGMPVVVRVWVHWALLHRGHPQSRALAAAYMSPAVLAEYRRIVERELSELGYEPHELLAWWEPAA